MHKIELDDSELDRLMTLFGWHLAFLKKAQRPVTEKRDCLQLANILNRGNPDWTDYNLDIEFPLPDGKEGAKMSQSASNDPAIAAEQLGLGATGTFSHGKFNNYDDDGGDIRLAIAADVEKGVVHINFGTPVKWMGLPPAEVDELIALLQKARAKFV